MLRAMANQETCFGYTIHVVDHDWDSGGLLDVEKTTLVPSRPMLNQMNDIWEIAVDMLENLIVKADRYRAPKSLEQDEEKAWYHTWPTRADFAYFRRQGVKTVEPRGMIDILVSSFAQRSDQDDLRALLTRAVRNWYEEEAERQLAEGQARDELERLLAETRTNEEAEGILA